MPQLLFVLGKGGVGRSTVAAGLGLACAARGERALVVQWSIADAISPWFDRAPTGHVESELVPRLSTMNFSAEETMREYFVDHLGLKLFYRAFVRNRHVRRFSRAVPGLEELLFLGRLMWLITIAGKERGWSYDRVIVDAPAMGHGLSLFGVPAAVTSLGVGGLLADECARVSAVLRDPARSGALVVTTAEELAVDETLEFWPRVAREMGRAPLACVLNRAAEPSLGALPPRAADCAWFRALARPQLAVVYDRLARRIARERVLAARLVPLIRVDDALFLDAQPIDLAAAALAPLLEEEVVACHA